MNKSRRDGPRGEEHSVWRAHAHESYFNPWHLVTRLWLGLYQRKVRTNQRSCKWSQINQAQEMILPVLHPLLEIRDPAFHPRPAPIGTPLHSLQSHHRFSHWPDFRPHWYSGYCHPDPEWDQRTHLWRHHNVYPRSISGKSPFWTLPAQHLEVPRNESQEHPAQQPVNGLHWGVRVWMHLLGRSQSKLAFLVRTPCIQIRIAGQSQHGPLSQGNLFNGFVIHPWVQYIRHGLLWMLVCGQRNAEMDSRAGEQISWSVAYIIIETHG